MYYFHESAKSHIEGINDRPEFKILSFQDKVVSMRMILVEDVREPFRVPNPKPGYERFYTKSTKWFPYRISFTDNGILIVYTKKNARPDIDSDRPYEIIRAYQDFGISPEGIQFEIEVSDPAKGDAVVEDYTIFINDQDVEIHAETEAGEESFSFKIDKGTCFPCSL